MNFIARWLPTRSLFTCKCCSGCQWQVIFKHHV